MSVERFRPYNETQLDLDHEDEAATEIERCWELKVHKLSPKLYAVDWALVAPDRAVVAFAEFKWRGNFERDYVLLSYAKTWRMVHLARDSGQPCRLFVRWPSGLYSARIAPDILGTLVWSGNPRGQPGDMEPCYELSMRHFQRVMPR